MAFQAQARHSLKRTWFNPQRCYRSRKYTTTGTHMFPPKGARIVVGMSGGVDSSVSARILAEQDYDLSAVFMRNWDTRDESGTDNGCEWERDWEDVQRVCKGIGIPCKMVDLSREYWTRVFEPALHDWEFGITPNPDVWCNREIKFGALLDRLYADSSISPDSWFATGHYARKSWHSSTANSAPRPKLLQALDRSKDQNYYLSSITEKGLAQSLFPIGGLSKKEVRELAKKYALPTAERPESMGLCFIGEKAKFRNFISQYISPNPGPIIELESGKTIGTHLGLWHYTIGENARLSGMPMRMFVARKDIGTNEIFVVPGTNHPALFCDSIRVKDWGWIWADSPPRELDSAHGLRAAVKFRYVMAEVPCTVQRDHGGSLVIVFDSPQKSVSPGQVAALWKGEWCLGCGIITESLSSYWNNQSVSPAPPAPAATKQIQGAVGAW